MDKNLKALTARNIGYNTISSILVLLMQFASNILMARILAPADYGIVGFAQIFINFMMQFGDFGINSALIQRKDVDRTYLYSGFTLKVLLSVLAFFMLIILAPASSLFIDHKAIPLVVRVLSVNLLISAFVFLPQVSLTRALDYKKLAIPQMISVAAGSAIAILLAYKGFAYWSIVAGSLLSNLLNALVMYALRPVPPAFAWNISVAKNLMQFGWSLLLPGIIIFIIINADNFAIGTTMGPERLGYYSIAFTWGSMISILMGNFFHKVLFPTFSKLQHDLLAIKKAYLTSIRYIAFLALPVNMLFLVEGKEFLVYILGRGTDRWLPALISFQVLCIYGILRALLEPIGNVIVGIGKPQLCLKAVIIVAAIEVALIYPAIAYCGIEGVAIAVTVAYVSQYFIYMRIIQKEINTDSSELFGTIKIALIATVLMAFSILCTRHFISSSLFSMIMGALVGFVVYLAAYGVLDKFKLFKEISALSRFA